MTLLRRDAYLDHIKPGIELDTFAALHNAPLQIGVLFPDDVLRRAEDEIAKHDGARTSQLRLGGLKFGGKRNNNRYQPYQIGLRRQVAILNHQDRISLQLGGLSPTGADLIVAGAEGWELLLPWVAPPSRSRTLNNLNDNYYVTLVDHSPPISFVQTVQSLKNVASCLDVVIHAPSTTGLS